MDENKKIKLVRITTVALSLKYLLSGQMRYMKENGFEVTMMSANGPEVESVIKNEQCQYYSLPLTRTIKPFSDIRCIFLLYRWLKKNKPDIIHSETPKAGLVGMLGGWLAGVPIRIHTVAGLPLMVESGFKYQMLVWVERVCNAAATIVWPNSFSLQKIMVQKKLCKPAKMKVLAFGSSNGTNTLRYSPNSIKNEKLDLIKAGIFYNEGLNYNLCVARLVRDKGIVELVQAFEHIYALDNKQRLLLVGPFEEKLDPLPQNVVHAIDTHPGIIHVPISDEVEYFLFVANLFIFPTYREGLPNVVMEAGSMGLPVVCSRVEGNVDLVQNKQTGLLFEKMNTEDLTEKWIYALQHTREMKEMAANLQNSVRARFDREIVWKAMHEAYRKQLAALG